MRGSSIRGIRVEWLKTGEMVDWGVEPEVYPGGARILHREWSHGETGLK